MSKIYDLIIIGGGPIGSISAYFIAKERKKLKFKNIVLVQKEPISYPGIAYPNSGGSIRWYFDDPEIEMATKKTAQFILNLKNKVDLSLIEDNYFFLNRGVFVPSINISGKKLIEFLKTKIKKMGVKIISRVNFINYTKEQNIYIVNTDKIKLKGKSIIFALGFKNKELFGINLEIEKRQLFVLKGNLKSILPHTILKIGKGILYFFTKKYDDGLKLVIGQENIWEHSLKPKPENYFKELISKEVIKILPFLKEAKLENILWGFDVKNKKPIVTELDEKVFCVNCGSAIRSIYYVGEKVLNSLLKYAK